MLAARPGATTATALGEALVYDLDAGTHRATALAERAAMPAGGTLRGPALLVEDHTTLVIPPGMAARCDAEGFIILRREGDAA